LKSRFTYLGESVVEVTIDGDAVTWHVLPAEQVPGDLNEPEPEPEQPGHDPGEVPLAAAPKPTKKKRTLMGTIRAAWFIIFTVIGEALTYLLDNLTGLSLPSGTVTAIGAVGYGLKKAIWPDTLL
jgi:hypothetical protein